MPNYLILSLICIFSIECIRLFDIFSNINSVLIITSKVRKVIFSKNISDHWKEIILPFYAWCIIRYCSKIIIIFIFIIINIILIDEMIIGFLNFVSSPIGIMSTFLISSAYIFLRKKISQ